MDNWSKILKSFGKDTVIIPGAAGAVILDGKILLVRHNRLNLWQIPGGIQETGESIQQTIERELLEELGLVLKTGELISVFSHPRWTIHFPDGNKLQQLTFFFRMEGALTPMTIQAEEISDYRFFAPDEIPDDTFECCKQKVKDWISFQGKVHLH